MKMQRGLEEPDGISNDSGRLSVIGLTRGNEVLLEWGRHLVARLENLTYPTSPFRFAPARTSLPTPNTANLLGKKVKSYTSQVQT